MLLFYQVLEKGRFFDKILTFLGRIKLLEHALVDVSVFCHFALIPLFGILTQKLKVLVSVVLFYSLVVFTQLRRT